jgi:hypothetical protein
VCSIVAVSVSAYLPAVDNKFITDDFGIFPFLEGLQKRAAYILEFPSELFRAASYVYFEGLFKVFGSMPEPYYWASIGLHALISTLVYFLVLRIRGSRLAALAAALFFAAYERHQEAVMWISAANELILTLSCLLFLLLWEHAISRDGESPIALPLAYVALAVALFSREAAVVLAPAAMLGLLRHGYTVWQTLKRSIPVLALVAAYVGLWLSQAGKDSFVVDSNNAFGFHFLLAYGTALGRLLLPAIPFFVAWILLRHRKAESPSPAPSFVFFGAILVMSIAPYSFLTYQDTLQSRHTYLPSLGLAALIGMSFAGIHARLASDYSKRACVALFAVLMAGNIGYIWFKKEPQFRQRAAPTSELLIILNSKEVYAGNLPLVKVCGFPMENPWWFEDAVDRFTTLPRDVVKLRDDCGNSDGSYSLTWDGSTAKYVKNSNKERRPPEAFEVAAGK